MNREELTAYAKNNISIGNESDALVADCDLIIFLLKNSEITIDESKVFAGSVNCEDIHQYVAWRRATEFMDEIGKANLQNGYDSKAYTGTQDFSHTNCEWESVLGLGIYGLSERIKSYLSSAAIGSKQYRFYYNVGRVYRECLSFIEKMSEIAFSENKLEMAKGLKNLTRSAPANLFEALQTIILYYNFQHIFDGTCLRSLGRLDNLLYRFYEREDKEYSKRLLLDFFKEIDKLKAPNNIPITLGGKDINGNDLINDLSYEFLRTYRIANTNNTKLHILVTDKTPRKIIAEAFESIREGNNSIVFINDKIAVESLLKLGEDRSDVVRYHVVGCYECGAFGEITCSCSGRVNIPKALEVTLNGGYDLISGKLVGFACNNKFNSFEELYDCFIKQLLYFCDNSIKIISIFENRFNKIHSTPIMSATYTCSMEKGGDIYCDSTAKYNNSSINALGIATAVDSLLAIKRLVYDEKKLTIEQFTEILKKDWKDNELLRLRIKNKYPKYGTGNVEADAFAKDIVDKMAGFVNGHKNCRGGVYRLGTFSIDWRWEFGEKLAASADGRKAGEPISQNTSATFGQDKLGATAHILSATAINNVNTPNTSILDLDFHSSAVAGENGIRALINTLDSFIQLGGFAVHYNVLNTEILKLAYNDPDKYPNLQVRLCGWNVLFSSLSNKEKEEFIKRSEKR